MSNDCISVSDKKYFGTIADVCNELFATDYKGPPGMGWFKPNSFEKTQLDKFKVWFPKIEPNETGWVNQLINNDNEIISKNASEKGKAQKGQENITFAGRGNGYDFIGIFRLDQIEADGTEHWIKIDDKCSILGRSK